MILACRSGSTFNLRCLEFVIGLELDKFLHAWRYPVFLLPEIDNLDRDAEKLCCIALGTVMFD